VGCVKCELCQVSSVSCVKCVKCELCQVWVVSSVSCVKCQVCELWVAWSVKCELCVVWVVCRRVTIHLELCQRAQGVSFDLVVFWWCSWWVLGDLYPSWEVGPLCESTHSYVWHDVWHDSFIRVTCGSRCVSCVSRDIIHHSNTAKHRNTLQHTASHCNTLQHTATHYNTLQHTATCVSWYNLSWTSWVCAGRVVEFVVFTWWSGRFLGHAYPSRLLCDFLVWLSSVTLECVSRLVLFVCD